MSCRRWRLCVALALAGCDAIGRSVVGEHSPAGEEVLCEQPLACSPLVLEAPGSVPELIQPVDLKRCTRNAQTSCASGTIAKIGQCPELPEELDMTLSNAVKSEVLRELSCRAVRLNQPEGSTNTAFSVEVGTWNDVQLELESVEPVSLELKGGKLDSVSLALHGPISLRLVDVSEGQDVRVLADNGPAHVELVRTTLDAVVLSVPRGDVLLRRGQLRRMTIEAARVELESAYVRDAVWQTQSLSAADTTLIRVRSQAERSVLSFCSADMTSFLACQALSVIDGTFRHVQIAACAEETAIYDTNISDAQLEGDLILDKSGLHNVVLGVGQVGSIMAWESLLADVSFCSNQQAFSVGGMSIARCAHCDLTPAPSEPAACLLDSAFLHSQNSGSCPRLDQPPICGDPQPKRMRPPLN